jgi:hypothetical protein
VLVLLVVLVGGFGTIVDIPTPGDVTFPEDVDDLDGSVLLEDGDVLDGTGGVTMLVETVPRASGWGCPIVEIPIPGGVTLLEDVEEVPEIEGIGAPGVLTVREVVDGGLLDEVIEILDRGAPGALTVRDVVEEVLADEDRELEDVETPEILDIGAPGALTVRDVVVVVDCLGMDTDTEVLVDDGLGGTEDPDVLLVFGVAVKYSLGTV